MAKVPTMKTGKTAVPAMGTDNEPALAPVKPVGGKPAAKPTGKKSGKRK